MNQENLSPRIIGGLALALGLVLLPHVLHLPLWIAPLVVILGGWRYRIAQGRTPAPPEIVRVLLGIAIMVGILLHYHTIFGRNAGVAFLVGLMGIKLLETRTRRDVMVTLFLSYFLIITNFLYSQAIPIALYLFVVMLVITATLVSLNDSNERLNLRQRLRLASVLVAQAIPLMVVAFLLFPRIEGGLWRLPTDHSSAMSGLSDSMSPGSISSLGLSDDIVFRVKIDNGVMPPPSQRYWRGPVFWWSDGHTWKIGNHQHEEPEAVEFSGAAVTYTLTQEANNQHWLFALELPQGAPADVPRSYMGSDYQLQSRFPVTTLLRYQVTSYPEYRVTAISRFQRDASLRLPKNKHPRARALAAQWRTQTQHAPDIVALALRYFNQHPFHYTLQPPLLEIDPVDEFLFDTRQGFCEHYAAAFTILMRAAGIPARVVSGYQGAEYNPLGDYWSVRQRDAHAWSEVWLEERGWVRVDPTSSVAPERVEQGIQIALPETSSRPLGFNLTEASLLRYSFEQLRAVTDALNHGWNEWVLGYGPELQRNFLAYLGLAGSYQVMIIALIVVTTTVLLILALWLGRNHQRQFSDPAQRLYARFCHKLARHGIIRRAEEGAFDFSQRAAAHLPPVATHIITIADLYMRVRYRGENDKLAQLKHAVAKFRP
jgi:protein-glutamine gamma-glutamyltransferase